MITPKTTETASSGSAETPIGEGTAGEEEIVFFDPPDFGTDEVKNTADDVVSSILAATSPDEKEEAEEAQPDVPSAEMLTAKISEWLSCKRNYDTQLIVAQAADDAGDIKSAQNAVLRYRYLIADARAKIAALNGDEDEERIQRTLAQDADSELILSNRALAHSVAGRFSRAAGDWSEDIDSEAVAELVAVVRKWDPTRSSLAHYAMQYLSKASKKQVIFFERPGQTYTEFTAAPAVREAQEALAQEGEVTSDAQIAEMTGYSVGVVKGARTRRPVSLDSPVSADGDATIGDLVPDSRISSIEDLLLGEEEIGWQDKFRSLTFGMSAIARYSLIKRAGTDGSAPMKITETAAWLSRGREDIRSILHRADEALVINGVDYLLTQPVSKGIISDDDLTGAAKRLGEQVLVRG